MATLYPLAAKAFATCAPMLGPAPRMSRIGAVVMFSVGPFGGFLLGVFGWLGNGESLEEREEAGRYGYICAQCTEYELDRIY